MNFRTVFEQAKESYTARLWEAFVFDLSLTAWPSPWPT